MIVVKNKLLTLKQEKIMSRLIKWYALAVILALISLSIYAAGGGNDNAPPFPVPLSCYSEEVGSSAIFERRL